MSGDEVVVSLAYVHLCLQVATWAGLTIGALLGLVVGRKVWGPQPPQRRRYGRWIIGG